MKRTFLVIVILVGTIMSKAQLRVGDAVPEIELPDTKDSIIKLSSFQGKVVLVDFGPVGVAPAGQAIPIYKDFTASIRIKGLKCLLFRLIQKERNG